MGPISFLITANELLEPEQLHRRFAKVMGARARTELAICGKYRCLAGSRSDGHQGALIYTESENDLLVIFDGAIHNRDELKRQFPATSRSTDDLELFVHLYKVLGADVVCKLNADFAAVVIDNKNNELFVARDRLGVRSLFHTPDEASYSIGSEVALLLEVVPRATIDEIAVRQYRKLRTFFNNRTLYSQIREFPPAHISLDRTLRAYWEFPKHSQPAPSDDELRNLLEDAVAIRGDSSAGSFLSGGLDSSIIVMLARPARTWSIGFAEQNEFEWAELVAEHSGSEHHNVVVDADTFLHSATQLVRRRREPLSVPNEVLMWLGGQQIAAATDRILSGEGADELFFGYDRIFRWAANNLWSIEAFDKHYSYGDHDDIEIVVEAISPFMGFERSIDRVAAFFQLAHLRGLLRRVDFSSRQHGLTLVTPFTDYRLVELMANVPFEYRMQDGIVKAPLKRVFGPLLPEAIVDRKKIGFPVPLADIFPQQTGKSPMEQWLAFNLEQIAVTMP